MRGTSCLRLTDCLQTRAQTLCGLAAASKEAYLHRRGCRFVPNDQFKYIHLPVAPPLLTAPSTLWTGRSVFDATCTDFLAIPATCCVDRPSGSLHMDSSARLLPVFKQCFISESHDGTQHLVLMVCLDSRVETAIRIGPNGSITESQARLSDPHFHQLICFADEFFD